MNKYLYFTKMLTVIDANKEFFLDTIAPSPDNLRYFLEEDYPQILCKAYNDEYSGKVPVKDITGDIHEHTPNIILFVEFDESFVENDTDCYAIAISIDSENNIRLFTLEKGTSVMEGKTQYYVGEFDITGKHVNYGMIEGAQITLFASEIINVINKK